MEGDQGCEDQAALCHRDASGEPLALAAIWENWKRPGTEEWVRTFCVITCRANELVADIHDPMPVILPPAAYDRWLANIEHERWSDGDGSKFNQRAIPPPWRSNAAVSRTTFPSLYCSDATP